jgi:hypothetical protein
MHPTLLLPTLFYIVTLLAVVPVRVLFITFAELLMSGHVAVVRKHRRITYS